MKKIEIELHEHLGLAGTLLLAGPAVVLLIAHQDPFLIIGTIAAAVSGALMLAGELTDHDQL